MKRSIFISRQLSENSELLSFLRKEKWEIHHHSLIRIERINFKIESKFDWLFISSSNGAKILFSAFFPSDDVKIAAVGETTANAIRGFGFDVNFVGDSGDMNQVAQSFAKIVGNQTVLFAGAESGSKK